MARALLLGLLGLLLLPSSALAGVASTETIVTDSKYGATEQVLRFAAGSGERNLLTLTQPGGSVVLHDAGALLRTGPGCVAVDPSTATCQATGSFIDAGDGDDSVTVPAITRQLVSVRGGEGADVLTGAGSLAGGPGRDLLRGGDACDRSCQPGRLAGGSGDDVLRGGPADEELSGDGSGPAWPPGIGDGQLSTDGGLGNDVIDGGAGTDKATYAGRSSAVRIDLGAARVTGAGGEGDRLEHIENATGGEDADVLLGDDGANVLEGGPGADRLDGRGGDDYLLGNVVPDANESSPTFTPADPGADSLHGGSGDDRLDAGGERRDALFGGPGDDVLENDSSFDDTHVRTVSCGAGSDVVRFTPQGQLLTDCETVAFASERVGVSARPARRGRTLRFSGTCRPEIGFDKPCGLAVRVRVGSSAVGQGRVSIPQGSRRALAVRGRRALRRGAVLDVAMTVQSLVGVPALKATWRVRLR